MQSSDEKNEMNGILNPLRMQTEQLHSSRILYSICTQNYTASMQSRPVHADPGYRWVTLQHLCLFYLLLMSGCAILNLLFAVCCWCLSPPKTNPWNSPFLSSSFSWFMVILTFFPFQCQLQICNCYISVSFLLLLNYHVMYMHTELIKSLGRKKSCSSLPSVSAHSWFFMYSRARLRLNRLW